MPRSAVKFAPGSDDTIRILSIPFGGPLPGGKDTDGEFFTKRTDLCLDWFPDQRPLLYDHGLDDGPGLTVVGRVDMKSFTTADDGHWVKAQLDRRNRYFVHIKQLIQNDALSGSTGALPYLVKRAKNGELLRWPWIEQSLTPIPANLYSTVSTGDVAKHYKAAGITFETARASTDRMRSLVAQARTSYQLSANSRGGVTGTKAGRVLSAANEAKIRDALDSLNAVLKALGSDDAETESGKRARLRVVRTKAMDEDGAVDQGTLTKMVPVVDQALALVIMLDDLIDPFGDTDIDDAIDMARVALVAADALIDTAYGQYSGAPM